jgi:hypothetical protein
MRHAIAVVLCAAAVSANAGVFDSWTDDSISDITGNVTDVRDKVLNGNIPQSAADLRRQLTKLQERGHMLSTTVEELLVWLERRRTPYLAFVGSGGSGP